MRQTRNPTYQKPQAYNLRRTNHSRALRKMEKEKGKKGLAKSPAQTPLAPIRKAIKKKGAPPKKKRKEERNPERKASFPTCSEHPPLPVPISEYDAMVHIPKHSRIKKTVR